MNKTITESLKCGIYNELNNKFQDVNLTVKYISQIGAEYLVNSLNLISTIHELKDPYTVGHQSRVSMLACKIAEKMGVSPNDSYYLQIFVSAHLHDIGKIAIPSEILVKPGKLWGEEHELIKKHPEFSAVILKDINLPWDIKTAILQHHERLDGTGYPFGLTDKDICPEAKIITVADVVEAMSSFRPYRAPIGIFRAIDEIRKNSGIYYDKKVVDATIAVFEDGFIFERQNFDLDFKHI